MLQIGASAARHHIKCFRQEQHAGEAESWGEPTLGPLCKVHAPNPDHTYCQSARKSDCWQCARKERSLR